MQVSVPLDQCIFTAVTTLLSFFPFPFAILGLIVKFAAQQGACLLKHHPVLKDKQE